MYIHKDYCPMGSSSHNIFHGFVVSNAGPTRQARTTYFLEALGKEGLVLILCLVEFISEAT
jgi:hypothetical protein